VTDKALLGHDGYCIASTTTDVGKDVVPNLRLVLLVRAGAGTVDGENAHVVGGKTPDGKRAAQRRNTFIGTDEMAVCCKSILLLACGFTLNVSNARRNVFLVNDRFALGLTELNFFLELLMFVGKPLGDLSTTEGELPRAIGNIEDR
jgi:hypothetical protein